MRIVQFVLVVAALAACAGVAASSAAADYETGTVYYLGPTWPGEYHTSGYDSPCSPTSGSTANFNSYGWATVALIDLWGSWRRSARSNVAPVSTYVTPDTFTQASSWVKNALCKNSADLPWMSLYMSCIRWLWRQDPIQLQCA